MIRFVVFNANILICIVLAHIVIVLRVVVDSPNDFPGLQCGDMCMRMCMHHICAHLQASFDNRVKFTEDNLEHVFDSADKPLDVGALSCVYLYMCVNVWVCMYVCVYERMNV